MLLTSAAAAAFSPCGEGRAGMPGEVPPSLQKKKKDFRDYNDADMARHLERREKDDYVEGDPPPHKDPQCRLASQNGAGQPESILEERKTLMMLVTVVRKTHRKGERRNHQPLAGKSFQCQPRRAEVYCGVRPRYLHVSLMGAIPGRAETLGAVKTGVLKYLWRNRHTLAEEEEDKRKIKRSKRKAK